MEEREFTEAITEGMKLVDVNQKIEENLHSARFVLCFSLNQLFSIIFLTLLVFKRIRSLLAYLILPVCINILYYLEVRVAFHSFS